MPAVTNGLLVKCYSGTKATGETQLAVPPLPSIIWPSHWALGY